MTVLNTAKPETLLEAEAMMGWVSESRYVSSVPKSFGQKVGLSFGSLLRIPYPDPPPCILGRGDSTFAGNYTEATMHVDGRRNSLFAMLAKYLSQAGFPSRHDQFMGGYTAPTVADYVLYDPRLSIPASWTVGYDTPGGLRVNSATADPLIFSPTDPFDRVRVFYAQNPGQGIFTVALDADAPFPQVNAAAAQALGKTTFTATLGVHTVKITRVSGQAPIAGIHTWNTAKPEILLINAAQGGLKVVDAINATYAFGPLLGAESFGAFLTIISIGINDLLVTSPSLVPVPTILANIQTLITSGKATGEVMLVTPPPLNEVSVSLARQLELESGYIKLAATNKCALIRSRAVFGPSASAARIAGLMGADEIHPSQLGTALWAQVIGGTIVAAVTQTSI